MKIVNLIIKNFRGIKSVELRDVPQTVIIAGPNGAGKSCVLDAIRLIKTLYGEYHINERNQWMSEFQLSDDTSPIFYDKKEKVEISADFVLYEEERDYIRANAHELVRHWIIRKSGFEDRRGGAPTAALIAQARHGAADLDKEVDGYVKKLIEELSKPILHGRIAIEYPENLSVGESVALSVICETYRPGYIGVVDYHGPQRSFSREVVQGINLSLEQNKQNQGQHALYNYTAKYSNIKSEMAASYIREIISQQAGAENVDKYNLSDTLKELFSTFFPDKEFLGPIPNAAGRLDFPVKLPSGKTHDLDELSAGEKEVIYGYLRLRSTAPKYSVLLLDEPEIHLNPRLVRGLPRFYARHLGEALRNQLWLVTHSDALLREVSGAVGFAIYHMQPSYLTEDGELQAKILSADTDLERLVYDLAGDLAAFRPGGKLVIFEGGGESAFDISMVGRLFPDFVEAVNVISGENKGKVRQLHEILDGAASKIPYKVFSVVDKDFDLPTGERAARLEWDVYHIENYLLDSQFILNAIETLGLDRRKWEGRIEGELREAARRTLGGIVRQRLEKEVNHLLVSCLDLRGDPKREVVDVISEAVKRSHQKISSLVEGDLSRASLDKMAEIIHREFESDLADGTWKKRFPGRDIIKEFVGKKNKELRGISYEMFRDVIISEMARVGHKPEGMKRIIEAIISG